MRKKFHNIDFKTGMGLSLRWVICDHLNQWYDRNMSMYENFVSLDEKEECFDPFDVRYLLNEMYAFYIVLCFLREITVLDKDIHNEFSNEIFNCKCKLEEILKKV